jgi:sulfite exporter TauE/SafE/copper chaperone CopZ
MPTQEYVFHVIGMHCKSCVILTDDELAKAAGVTEARSDLGTRTVRVRGDFSGRSAAEIAAALSELLRQYGYSLSTEKPRRQRAWREFLIATPAAAAVLLGFFLLQRSGLLNVAGDGEMTLGLAFVIGVVASLSSCLAVVGGLALSLGATYARHEDRAKPMLLFHGSRLAAFAVLGGLVGALGAAARPSLQTTLALGLLTGAVMLVLGLNLLDLFDWTDRLLPRMPDAVSRRALGAARHRHALMPVLAGIATFFLPCGFTQSMQLYALTSGSFRTGAAAMTAFALGTLPVLALMSFGFQGIGRNVRGTFFKAAGLVVIAFALISILGSLTALGVIRPFMNL